MSKVIATIKDIEVKEIIRQCLNEAEHFGNPTTPYKMVAKYFAAFFVKQNSKFNAHAFIKKCSLDFSS